MQYGIQDMSGLVEPKTELPKEELKIEKEMALFATSKEYARLKEHLTSRLEFYQQYLPDGRGISQVPTEERANMWLVANAVCGEIKMILATYENAKEAVDATRS